MATVDGLQTVLRQVFDYAIENHYIRDNVCSKVMKKIKEQFKTEKDISALSRAEQSRLLSYIQEYDKKKKSHWYPLIATMVYTGIRIGEMSGLQWSDINISETDDSGTMTIRHNHVYYKDSEMETMIHSIHEPKTEAGKRSFKLTKPALEAILMQKELGLEYTDKPIDGYTDFVFINKEGRAFQQQNVNEALRRIITSANLDAEKRIENGENVVLIHPITSHSLRRTFVTRCAEAGLPVKVTMKLVGHSDADTTMKIYTKVGREWEDENITLLDDFLESKVIDV